MTYQVTPAPARAAPEPRSNSVLERRTASTPAAPATTQLVRHRYQFLAHIPRVAQDHSPSPVIESDRAAVRADRREIWSDASPGAEAPEPAQAVETAGIAGELASPAITEIEEGQSVSLPDIAPQQPLVEETDAIASTLTYAPTITQAGAAPGGFGVTRPYSFGLSGISVTLAGGTYTVAATVDNAIQYQVRASTGPSGQLDIGSPTDGDITHANYTSVASDLTPDMSDLNGRPPRNNFWSKSLTIRHELFHCTDGRAHARSGVTLAQTWLNGQTATSVAGVRTLLGRVPTRVAATRRAAMTYPGREQRAYGDGAPSYRTLANAIKARGDAGFYRLGDFPITTPAGPGTAYA